MRRGIASLCFCILAAAATPAQEMEFQVGVGLGIGDFAATYAEAPIYAPLFLGIRSDDITVTLKFDFELFYEDAPPAIQADIGFPVVDEGLLSILVNGTLGIMRYPPHTWRGIGDYITIDTSTDSVEPFLGAGVTIGMRFDDFFVISPRWNLLIGAAYVSAVRMIAPVFGFEVQVMLGVPLN